jgi:hypothetical protein
MPEYIDAYGFILLRQLGNAVILDSWLFMPKKNCHGIFSNYSCRFWEWQYAYFF